MNSGSVWDGRLLHDPRRDLQSIFAKRHRRRAGVRFHARDDAVVPAKPQNAGDDANRLVGIFEDRALFPPGSVEFDCALLMRGIEHEWQGRGQLLGGGARCECVR